VIAPEARPTVALRPGVAYPDWSAVASPTVARALRAYLLASCIEQRWAGLSDDEARVHRAVLTAFAEAGAAPTATHLAATTGLARAVVVASLASLAERDVLVGDDDGRIIGAYPFSAHSRGHRVRLDGRAVEAMCAIDALGIGAMLGVDSTIASACAQCGAPIHIATRDGGRTLKTRAPATTLVWFGTGYADACAANSACRTMAFLCHDADLDAWRSTTEAAGSRLSLPEALELSRAMFTPFLAAPVSPSENLEKTS